MSITFSEKTFHFLVSLTFIQKIKVVKKKKGYNPPRPNRNPPAGASTHVVCRSQSSRQAWGHVDSSHPERSGGTSVTSHQRTEVVGLLAAGPNFTGTDIPLPLQQSFKGDRAEPRRSQRRHSRCISSVQTQTLPLPKWPKRSQGP